MEVYNFDVPPEKMQAMKDFAVKIRKKHPHMKPDRVAKKVAAEFRVNVIKTEDDRDSIANHTNSKG